MDIQFIPTGEQDVLRRNYFISNIEKEDIGSAEGYLNDHGELLSVIKIYNSDYQKRGYGFIAFKKIFDELNSEITITTIIGSWHSGEEFQDFEEGMSTNLKEFIRCQEMGKDFEECVFSTPTGKWALKLGFSNCKLSKLEFDEVVVKFTK